MTDTQQTQLVTMLRNVVNEALRATDIVRGLRSYFISGASSLQDTSVTHLVDECAARFSQKAAKADVALVTDYTHHDDHVLVDQVQISTALGNLLKNAIDASSPGAQVRVTVSSDEKQMLRIRVIDQGELLDADAADQVFRPFYSKKKDGLGLGLSVSRSLVENNGGVLRYQTHPEKCFEILLPLGDSVDE